MIDTVADTDSSDPVRLRPVAEVASQANTIVAQVVAELKVLLPDIIIEHIGATALPDGVTKGDVDVNLRVPAPDFVRTVEVLSGQFTIAQPENWTPTFASFSDPSRALPLGLQVTVVDSREDFLVHLRELMRVDVSLRNEYQRCKVQSAALGARGYWEAKNRMLQEVLGRGRSGIEGQ